MMMMKKTTVVTYPRRMKKQLKRLNRSKIAPLRSVTIRTMMTIMNSKEVSNLELPRTLNLNRKVT